MYVDNAILYITLRKKTLRERLKKDFSVMIIYLHFLKRQLVVSIFLLNIR